MNKNLIIFGVVMVVLVVGVFAFNKTEPITENKVTNSDLSQNKEQEHEQEDGHGDGKIDHHLHDATVKVSDKDFTAEMNSLGLMPLAGESGAVGYGVLTDKGTDVVVVSTTHAGVYDSEVQKDASDPVWHNHIVKLGAVELCGENPGVIDISFESPGDITVKNDGLVMVNIPETFAGTHSLTGNNLSFAPGTDVQGVVQFHLAPIFKNGSELQAVCVTDIEKIPFELI
jgi:hypothetical protein